MRTRILVPLGLFAALAAAQSVSPAIAPVAARAGEKTDEPAESTDASVSGASVTGDGIPGLASGAATRVYPLMNVEIVDSRGTKTSLVAFHRISGENVFQGYLGAASIEVPYDRVAELRIATPEEPGGRMQAHFRLHSGKDVDATFDEREGEQLFAGYANFGRVTIYWRDLRLLKFTARTRTSDLPKYGIATGGVDARMTDRDGVTTELVAFHRVSGDNAIEGLRGSSRVEVPLRIVESATFRRNVGHPFLMGEFKLRGREPVVLRFPRYAEDPLYRGRAEFGDLRIRLGEIHDLVVHRSTPALRDLDPVAAAEGREVEIGDPEKR